MTRKQTPSYVLTLKLDTNNRDESILDKRFEDSPRTLVTLVMS